MSEIIPSSHTFVIKEVLSTAWGLVKKYFKTVVVLLLITMIPGAVETLITWIIQQIPGATQMITDPMTNMPSVQPVGVWAIIINILSIISGVVGAWLGLGLVKANLQILEDKKPEYSILTSSPWIRVARLIGGGILVGLAVIAGIIALILPGIWIATRLSLFQYYIAEWYGAIDSIKASWAATKNNFWQIFGIGFAYAGIILLGALALGVGLLWAIPTVSLAQAYVYKKLKANTPSNIHTIEDKINA